MESSFFSDPPTAMTEVTCQISKLCSLFPFVKTSGFVEINDIQ